MEKENKNLKNIIILLVIVIVLLIGFGIFFIIEFHEEREDIHDLSRDRVNNFVPSKDIDEDDYFNSTPDNQNYITKDQALDIALNDASMSKNNVYDIDIELDYKYGKTVYEVDFDYQSMEYEYYIDALTGTIIKSFQSRNY